MLPTNPNPERYSRRLVEWGANLPHLPQEVPELSDADKRALVASLKTL